MSERDVEVLKRITQEQREDVQAILSLLNSNDRTKRMGLVEKVDTLDARISEFISDYHKSEEVKKAKLAAYATAGGLVALFLKWVLGLFF